MSEETNHGLMGYKEHHSHCSMVLPPWCSDTAWPHNLARLVWLRRGEAGPEEVWQGQEENLIGGKLPCSPVRFLPAELGVPWERQRGEERARAAELCLRDRTLQVGACPSSSAAPGLAAAELRATATAYTLTHPQLVPGAPCPIISDVLGDRLAEQVAP